jgi:hypothetical protein
MITELVYFDLPHGMSRDEALAKYRQTAPAWAANDELLHKFYFFDAAGALGGGVYVWRTLDAAQRWHGGEYRARIRALYGSEPRITVHDTLLVVDNVNQLVHEPPMA